MSVIKQTIQEELRRIEQEEQVRIIYACESGSRAWGFASRDSDYDVRFIYIRPEDGYLSIFPKRDVIERPISGVLDINGWDLKKALGLFRKSNPPLMEWLQSPIVYREDPEAAAELRGLLPRLFSPRSSMLHYLHMARGNYREYLQGDLVRLKKYFYVLRPVLACQWVSTYNTMPPTEFGKLMEALVPEGTNIRTELERLLARKREADELGLGPRLDTINAFLEEKMEHYSKEAASMPVADQANGETLDLLFRKMVRTAWTQMTSDKAEG